MSTKSKIDRLWKQFQDAIKAAYKSDGSETAASLRDYTESSWHNDLAKLVDAEAANEKQHRRMAPDGCSPISRQAAAKLLLLGNVVEGATRYSEVPPATIFLQFRKSAAEGITLGYLVRKHLTPEFIAEVQALDYAKIMNPEKVSS